MSALTQERNTTELLGPISYERVVASGKTVYAGSLVAQDANGKAVPAADAANLVVLGRAENTAAAGETVRIRTGLFVFDSGASGEAITVTAIGSACYALDDHTVGLAGGTNTVKAGVVADVIADGVVVKIG